MYCNAMQSIFRENNMIPSSISMYLPPPEKHVLALKSNHFELAFCEVSDGQKWAKSQLRAGRGEGLLLFGDFSWDVPLGDLSRGFSWLPADPPAIGREGLLLLVEYLRSSVTWYELFHFPETANPRKMQILTFCSTLTNEQHNCLGFAVRDTISGFYV